MDVKDESENVCSVNERKKERTKREKEKRMQKQSKFRRNTSGARNAGVPSMSLKFVFCSAVWLVPKSDSFPRGFSSSRENETISRLSGFRSRWMYLLSWR